MSGRRWRLLSLILLVGCSVGLMAYLTLSMGFWNRVFTGASQQESVNRVVSAGKSRPPDLVYLTNAVGHPDWHVAAIAAQQLKQLQQDGEIAPEQATFVISSLLEALASDGHWWRLGWDKDDPEFEQFRGAAIAATVEFGSAALPQLQTALESGKTPKQEAACWVVLGMIKRGYVDATNLNQQGIKGRIEQLAHDGTHEGVRAACTAAIQ
jgi:hypothetical protein